MMCVEYKNTLLELEEILKHAQLLKMREEGRKVALDERENKKGERKTTTKS